MGARTPVEKGLERAAAKVRRLAPGFFANLIRFHFTGGTVTEALSPQEFYLAQQLRDGRSYEENNTLGRSYPNARYVTANTSVGHG